jgi:hypothetical protein
MEAELVALRRRLAAVEAALADRLPAAAPKRRPRAKSQAPFGWRCDETGEFTAVPEQQADPADAPDERPRPVVAGDLPPRCGAPESRSAI